MVYFDEKSRINAKIDGENVKIPYRIYFNEPENIKSLNSIQKDILACIYSRHYNGFIRQKYMENIIKK